jgi:hypothetical protein
MPFVKEKCMINFNLISSRSGGSGMGNNKVNLFYHLLYCYGRRETRHLFIHLNYSLLCCNNSTIYCWFYLCVFALSDLEIPGQGKNMNKEEGSQKSETRWIEMDNSDIAIKTPVSLKKKTVARVPAFPRSHLAVTADQKLSSKPHVKKLERSAVRRVI